VAANDGLNDLAVANFGDNTVSTPDVL